MRLKGAHALATAATLRHGLVMMELDRARAIAEQAHRSDCEESGTPLICHVQRVASAVPAVARPVAWLHEVLVWTSVTEHELLRQGLANDQLRALRLLSRASHSLSGAAYLAHLDLVACAAGLSGILARMVMIADLEDRCRHPLARHDGWLPPYARGLALLVSGNDGRDLPQDSHGSPLWPEDRRDPRPRASSPS